MRDNKNLSADLKRIAWWLYKGNTRLGNSFLERTIIQYPNLRENIKEEIEKIRDEKEDILKRSELALTLSSRLKLMNN